MEIEQDRFEFPMDETTEKVEVLSRKFREDRGGGAVEAHIHPTYRPYLEVFDDLPAAL